MWNCIDSISGITKHVTVESVYDHLVDYFGYECDEEPSYTFPDLKKSLENSKDMVIVGAANKKSYNIQTILVARCTQ